MPRYAIAVPIEAEGARGVTCNIGTSGVRFVFPVQLPIGRDVQFTVYLTGGDGRSPSKVICKGPVVGASLRDDGSFELEASIREFDVAFDPPARRTAT